MCTILWNRWENFWILFNCKQLVMQRIEHLRQVLKRHTALYGVHYCCCEKCVPYIRGYKRKELFSRPLCKQSRGCVPNHMPLWEKLLPDLIPVSEWWKNVWRLTNWARENYIGTNKQVTKNLNLGYSTYTVHADRAQQGSDAIFVLARTFMPGYSKTCA